MSSFTNTMISLKGILAQATNGSLTSSDMQTYADQIDQLLSEGVDVANTQSNGVYIFGGTNTKQQPFTLAANNASIAANPNGITGSIQIPVNEGVTQVVNLDGQQAFQGTAIFNLMIQVRNELQAGQPPTTAEAQAVDTYIDDVANATGKAGAIMQNLTNNDTMLSGQQTQLQQMLSVQQDSDVAATTIKMNQDQLDLQAALSSGASVLPDTLLNFLK
jgi:flagellar hook-associated protein 3 FlgL